MRPRARLALVALGLAVVTSAAACTDRACIEWPEARGTTCAAPDDALEYMTLPPTPFGGECQEIRSVDSEGDYDEEDLICCYDVTMTGEQNNQFNCCGC